MNVVSSDPASPERVELVANGLGIVLNSNKLAFGSQAVGTTSAPQTVTITNKNATSIGRYAPRYPGIAAELHHQG